MAGGGTDTPGAAARELAVRLEALRTASGRSYGALARRAGIGAATLHRYCAGRTVPQEFAPVERIARLCGCGREEAAELYRLWVLADADRRAAVRAGGAPAGAGPSPAQPPPEARERAGGPPPGGEPTEAPAAGRSGQQAAGAAEPVPLREPVDGAAATGPVAAAPADGAPGPAGRPRRGGPGRAGPRRKAPRPRTAVLVLSCAVAAALALAIGLRPSAGGAPGPGVPDRAAAGAGPDPAGSAGPPPLTWTVDDDLWESGCGHTYLLDRAPAEVPAPPVQADAGAWAARLGAVDGGSTRVGVTVQGTGPATVVLEAVQVRVVERREPRGLRAYRMDSGCGGALTPRLFDVDLDRPRPLARPLPGNDSGRLLPAADLPYTVSRAEPETLLFEGRSVGCDCDWYLEVRWSSGGRSGTVRIDDGGRPFRTSTPAGGTAYAYDYALGSWRPAPTADS
ncbi:helix-turn-helix domain-containing protein [Streptomyces sp. C10-9-1]|uniref:helix-turn-helix domain-containing protein n=1 Tax=Streptomyces sp. C10-9-1 TaxID=1859285 RepID=UPI00211187BB|nr:helix-turn-helix transcriptional regulator [Streptomyces sp. C10-9-1]MCQ6553394.1 helix-turn-helix domain-containing protein [Streptomyces sp. C10-9-1]